MLQKSAKVENLCAITMDKEIDPSRKCLQPLFPDLTEQELKEVEEAFYGYLEIAWRIFRRIEMEREQKSQENTD